MAGPTVTLVGSVLGWARSGEATRSSFGLLRSARTLGVLPGSLDGLAPMWYLLPLAVGLVWLAATAAHWRSAAVLAVLIGLAAGVAAVAVARSPLPLLAGMVVASVGAGLSVLGGLTVLVLPR